MAPPGKTSLRVVVGDDLETLADDLAEHLGSVHQAVLARDLIVVPTPGVGRWLDERLSHRLGASLLADGICANVDFLLWGGLLGRVLRRRRDEPDPWSVGSMTLTALGFLVDEAGQGAARLTQRRRDRCGSPSRALPPTSTTSSSGGARTSRTTGSTVTSRNLAHPCCVTWPPPSRHLPLIAR